MTNHSDDDIDGDGVPNAYDYDHDGDGILDEFDDTPNGPAKAKGCSVGGGPGDPIVPAAILLGLLLLGWRRRRA